jgi:hypothetical protein
MDSQIDDQLPLNFLHDRMQRQTGSHKFWHFSDQLFLRSFYITQDSVVGNSVEQLDSVQASEMFTM